MRNAECGMLKCQAFDVVNEGKAPHRFATFSVQHSAFIVLFFFALFLLPIQHLTAAGNLDLFYHPYTVEPDTTKMIYPIPVNTGNPLQDLNNNSPFYLSDPSNFETEIIYDPLTGQYTFKRRIGQFYYDG